MNRWKILNKKNRGIHYFGYRGLNLFLFSDLKRKLVFSRRAAMASDGNEGAGKLHVAMNEGLSHTDFEFQQRGEGQLSLINCFRRGMQEELGFNEYDERLGSLNVFDCFLVKDSFQFGIFAWASYSGYFEEIRLQTFSENKFAWEKRPTHTRAKCKTR